MQQQLTKLKDKQFRIYETKNYIKAYITTAITYLKHCYHIFI